MTSPLDALLGWCEANNTGQLLIVENGRTFVDQCGNGATPSTTFDLGSGQKSIVSFVVGILVARGELDLDAPVSTWLGEGWTAASADDERAILLRHLLTMTSGLRDDFTRESPPGETWYYNNNGYHQIRKAMENATGSSCQELCAELLFDPIGMDSSTWEERPQMLDSAGWALSGLRTTAHDMGRFGHMRIAGSSGDSAELGCDPDYFRASLQPSQELNPSYGYLWWLYDGERAKVPGLRRGDEPDPRKLFGGVDLDRRLAPSAPAGMFGGFGTGDQRLYLVPDRGLVVVRHGAAANAAATGLSRFDEQFWQLLSPALSTLTDPSTPQEPAP